MTTKQINKHLPEILPRLETTAKRMCMKYQRSYDWQDMISIAYLYVIDKRKEIKDADMLRRWMTAKVCQEVALSQSQTNLKLGIRSHEYIPELDHRTDFDEDPYEGALKAIEEYRTIPDRVKKTIFEVYYDKEICTVREMASYFGFSTKYASQFINEMKADLRRLETQSLY